MAQSNAESYTTSSLAAFTGTSNITTIGTISSGTVPFANTTGCAASNIVSGNTYLNSVSGGTDPFAGNYDAVGSASTAQSNAEAYTDTSFSNFTTKVTARVASTPADIIAQTPWTYSNGTAGVGATLLTGSNITTLDGVSLSVNDIVLIPNLLVGTTNSNWIANGLYVVTSLAGSQILLTRHTSMDSQLKYGGAVVPVVLGTANGNTVWVCDIDPDSPPTVGTTAIAFSQIAYDPAGTCTSQLAAFTGTSNITTIGTISSGTVPFANTTGCAASNIVSGNTYLNSVSGGTDPFAGNYDAVGSASTAQSNAESYTDTSFQNFTTKPTAETSTTVQWSSGRDQHAIARGKTRAVRLKAAAPVPRNVRRPARLRARLVAIRR